MTFELGCLENNIFSEESTKASALLPMVRHPVAKLFRPSQEVVLFGETSEPSAEFSSNLQSPGVLGLAVNRLSSGGCTCAA